MFKCDLYPPSGNLECAISSLNDIGDEITVLNTDWIIGGDFNVDVHAKNSANSTKSKKLQNNFALRHSLTQMITKITRKIITSATIIDHIYLSNVDLVYD